MVHGVTQDERLLAALAHGAIILPFWGLILSAVVWITQREKSAYVRREGLQALGWQIGQILAGFFGLLCYFAFFFLLFSALFAGAEPGEPSPIVLAPRAVLVLPGTMVLCFIVVGLYAANRAFKGRPFTYPVIGRRVDAFLADA